MQAFSTSGSFSFSHTAWRLAGSWTSPLIVIAMGASPHTLICYIPVKAPRTEKKGRRRPCGMHIRRRESFEPQRFGIGRQRREWLGRAHHEHLPLAPARPHAVELSDAHRL